MHKIFNKKNWKILLFLSIEIILYFLIIFVIYCFVEDPDISGVLVIYAQYIFVLVNSIGALLLSKKHNLIHLGLIFTIFADLFLTFLLAYNKQDLTLGLLFFLLTHLCYFIFLLKQQTKNERKTHIIIRTTASILVPLIELLVFKDTINLVLIIAGIYGTNIIMNCVYAFIKFKMNKLLAIALILFIHCDIVVAIGACDSMKMISIGDSLFLRCIFYWSFLGKNFNVAWINYVPSQTLIALFAIQQERKIFVE